MRRRRDAGTYPGRDRKKAGRRTGGYHLQRQFTLVHNAQITTIDSFCLYVIRNYFYKIDLEPNFRVADEGELSLLRSDVLGKLLEAHYAAGEEAFLSFVAGYGSAKSDQGDPGYDLKDVYLRAELSVAG